ncbi:hypothetical protein IRJ41_024936 [Triplophysa rosa]|uniref:Uncharacterized protein n=1 Tax=Triplophysa rosa TaxID=992332 RepID=A0A9W7TL02_TRIRA|nr:hypothetical protein IRJ41_024936 [Triplophysa rosa]
MGELRADSGEVICCYGVTGQLAFSLTSLSLTYRCAHRLVKLRGFIDGESEAVMSRCCLPPALFCERRSGFVLKGISVAS